MTMTIAAENGFEVGKIYRVKEGVYKNYHTTGMILKFIQDDGSDMPLFKILEGKAKYATDNNEIYVYIYDLEPTSVDNINGKQMSNKTEVQITTVIKEDTHNIGDYYKLGDEIYILASVQGKAVLICLNDGRFYASPYDNESVGFLTTKEFAEVRGNNDAFVKVQKVKISIE